MAFPAGPWPAGLSPPTYGAFFRVEPALMGVWGDTGSDRSLGPGDLVHDGSASAVPRAGGETTALCYVEGWRT